MRVGELLGGGFSLGKLLGGVSLGESLGGVILGKLFGDKLLGFVILKDPCQGVGDRII